MRNFKFCNTYPNLIGVPSHPADLRYYTRSTKLISRMSKSKRLLLEHCIKGSLRERNWGVSIHGPQVVIGCAYSESTPGSLFLFAISYCFLLTSCRSLLFLWRALGPSFIRSAPPPHTHAQPSTHMHKRMQQCAMQ